MESGEDDDWCCFIKVTLLPLLCLASDPAGLVWLIGHLPYANGVEYSFYRVLTFLLVLLSLLTISVRI